MRASHADREQVIDMLKAAFVQGRLAKDEFDLRVGRVLASRTYADLGAVTAVGMGMLAGFRAGFGEWALTGPAGISAVTAPRSA